MAKATRGYDQLDRQLAALERSSRKAALEAGARVIAEEMRRLAPVDTGTLQGSIAVTDDRPGGVYHRRQDGEITVYIGPQGSIEDGPVFYARFVEFGTSRHAGQPFLRPAIANKQGEAQRVMAEHLRQTIRQAMK